MLHVNNLCRGRQNYTIASSFTASVDPPNSSAAFATTGIFFDDGVNLVAGDLIHTVGAYWNNAISNFAVLIALRNSATSLTIVAEQVKAHPGSGWFDVALDVPFLVPATGTYIIGSFGTIGTEAFNTTGARISKATADPGLTTVTGCGRNTDGTVGVRYYKAI